jgi:hypothetical protein
VSKLPGDGASVATCPLAFTVIADKWQQELSVEIVSEP